MDCKDRDIRAAAPQRPAVGPPLAPFVSVEAQRCPAHRVQTRRNARSVRRLRRCLSVRSRHQHPLVRAETGPHPTQPAPTMSVVVFAWSACRRHRMHLGCLAQYRAQAHGPHDLLCPLCRHSRCPDCVRGGWSGLHDEFLRSQCRREGVRSGFRVKPRCSKLSKITNSARLLPAMRPNHERRLESPCCAATGSQPWGVRMGSTSCGYRTARCNGRPCPSGATLA